MVVLYVSLLLNIKDLVDAFNSLTVNENPETVAWILISNGVVMVLWLSADLYWTVGIQVYKSSKKGKHEHEGRNAYVRVDNNDIQTRLNHS